MSELVNVDNNQALVVDIVKVSNPHRVACNGGGGALGHPEVYFELGANERATCNYCGKVFVLDHATAGH